VIGAFAAAWVAVYIGAATLAIVRWNRRARAHRAAGRSDGTQVLEHAVLVRPCAGGEAALAERLAESGGARRVVLAIGEATDPAAPAAEAAAQALRARGIAAEIVLTRARGPNHKADQLARALAHPAAAAHPFLIVADSDVDLSGVALAELVAPLEDPRVGASWAPPAETGPARGVGDRVSRAVLGASLHAFPLLSTIDPRGMVGKLVALRRDALESAGGFSPLCLHLGEDMELARRLTAKGYAVRASAIVAPSRAEGRSLASAHARYVRWLQVVRAQRAALLVTYPLLLAPAPLLLALAAVGVAKGDPLVTVACAVGLSVRLVVACAARRATGGSFSPATAGAEALVADVALVAALLSAMSTRRVAWRTRILRLGRGGHLEEMAP
jgi:ceramide glucosyltransferase